MSDPVKVDNGNPIGDSSHREPIAKGLKSGAVILSPSDTARIGAKDMKACGVDLSIAKRLKTGAGIVVHDVKQNISSCESQDVNKKFREYALKRDPADATRGPARQSSKVGKSLPAWMDPGQYPDGCIIQVDRYKAGDLLRWPQMRETPSTAAAERERGSTEQSVKSRLNCAFKLGNAETSWIAMATLTYRDSPADYETVQRHWTRFKDRLRKAFPGSEWAWILEFQKRGAAHFHVFLGDGDGIGLALKTEETVTRKRKGKDTEIFNGPVSSWIAETWIDVVGDTSKRFLSFQRGGIVEKMRSADAAGRYAAKEASKRVQKSAPWPVLQWWGMSNGIRPRFRESLTMTVADFKRLFPDLPACSRLWSHADI